MSNMCDKCEVMCNSPFSSKEFLLSAQFRFDLVWIEFWIVSMVPLFNRANGLLIKKSISEYCSDEKTSSIWN